jgi:4-amino-4-deoxy-L-arabinose transferase-like glycosyltransferase
MNISSKAYPASARMTALPVNHTPTSASASRTGWLLVALGAAFRILSFLVSANSGGDASARVALTSLWLQHPTFKLIFDAYPPGHFWLIGLFALLFGDVTLAGRLLSLVLGIASLFFVWKLTEELFGERAGLLALAVFAFFSMHIGYSTTSSAEVSYAFFLLVALYFFFSYYTVAPALWRLGLAGLALSMGESIRYEAWIICFGMGMICLWFAFKPPLQSSDRARVWSVLVFAISAGAWPLGWMAYCWRRFGDPLYQITDTHKRVAILLAKQPQSHAYEVLLIPAVLLMALSPFAIGAAFYGAKRWFGSSASTAFILLTAFFAAVQFSQIARGEVVAVARYAMTLGVLLAVLSGPGFEAIGERLWPSKPGRILAIVIVLLSINLAAVLALSEFKNPVREKIASISPRLRYPDRITGVGAYLRQHLNPQDRVMFDDYNVESNILATASGFPLIYGDRAYLAGVKSALTPEEYFQSQHPRFLVYSDRGVLREWKDLPPTCGIVTDHSIKLLCVYANNFYRIYEITYS